MLYELVGIARLPPAGGHGATEAKELLKYVGRLVIENRGVIRRIDNLGIRPLPKIINKHRMSHLLGCHYYMRFDASPAVQNEIRRQLQMDPRTIRATFVRLGGENLKSLLDSSH
jgi:small subunit ribosomal protein S6